MQGRSSAALGKLDAGNPTCIIELFRWTCHVDGHSRSVWLLSALASDDYVLNQPSGRSIGGAALALMDGQLSLEGRLYATSTNDHDRRACDRFFNGNHEGHVCLAPCEWMLLDLKATKERYDAARVQATPRPESVEDETVHATTPATVTTRNGALAGPSSDDDQGDIASRLLASAQSNNSSLNTPANARGRRANGEVPRSIIRSSARLQQITSPEA